MSKDDINTRISVMEQKFDQIFMVISELKGVVEGLSTTFIKDHNEKMSIMRTDIELLKQTSVENTKKVGWVSGVIRAFMGMVGLAVLASVLGTVLK